MKYVLRMYITEVSEQKKEKKTKAIPATGREGP
jgi:hypothetical protein